MVLGVLLSLGAAVHAGQECKAVYGSGANNVTLATGSSSELGLVQALCD